MDTIFTLDETNGIQERDIGGGEDLFRSPGNTVWSVFGGGVEPRGQYLHRQVWSRALWGRTLYLNYIKLFQSDNALDNATLVNLALYKTFLLQRGLISPLWNIDDLHVRYIESQTEVDGYDIAAAFAAIPGADIVGVLTEARRARVKSMLPELVTIMGYMFRARGHHYKPEFEPTYIRLMAKVGIAPTDLGCTIAQLFTLGLHCIPPLILDEYWLWCVQNGKTSGALCKRYNCAPAGSAGLYAIRIGLNDLIAVMPVIGERYHDTIQNFEAFMDTLANNRWVGSINHNFYGVARQEIDETTLYALASIIFSAYEAFSPGVPLTKSLSLKRFAENAPLTGSIVGTMFKTLLKSESFAQKYLEGPGTT